MKRAAASLLFIALLGACVISDPDGEGAEIVPTTGPESDLPDVIPPIVPTIGAGLHGTRQDPLRPGVTVRVGDWEVTYLGALLDGTNAVLDENFFSGPPVEGRQFVLLQFEATHVGGGVIGLWWVDVRVYVLGGKNDTFGGVIDDYCGVIPNDIADTDEVFGLGEVKGSECVSVPTDQLEGALVIVEEAFTFGDDDRTFYFLTRD